MLAHFQLYPELSAGTRNTGECSCGPGRSQQDLKDSIPQGLCACLYTDQGCQAPFLPGSQAPEFGSKGHSIYRNQTWDHRQYLVRMCCCPEQAVIDSLPGETIRQKRASSLAVAAACCSLTVGMTTIFPLKKRSGRRSLLPDLQSIYILEVFHALADSVSAPLLTELQNTLLVPVAYYF